MSRRKSNRSRSLIDVLRSLGVNVDPAIEAAIKHEKELHTDVDTGDLLVRMDVASPALVESAVVIAEREGSREAIEHRYAQAKQSLKETGRASLGLSNAAYAIAKK